MDTIGIIQMAHDNPLNNIVGGKPVYVPWNSKRLCRLARMYSYSMGPVQVEMSTQWSQNPAVFQQFSEAGELMPAHIRNMTNLIAPGCS